MTINITITAESAEHAQMEMRALLAGDGRSNGAITTQLPDSIATEAGASGQAKRASGRTRAAAAEKAAEAVAAEKPAEPETVAQADAAKQDAADEAADTAAQKAADPVKLTHDDVKKMLGGYVMAYGMEAAQADGVGFIGAPKLSSIPDTQADLAKAILGIASGIEKNPNKREIAGDGITAEKLAELKPIVAAAREAK